MIFGKFMARFNKRGFTLIELIVVIAILAILAVTAVMAIGGVTDEARRSTLMADCNTVVRSLNTYNSLVASGGQLTDYGDGDNLIGHDGDTNDITNLVLRTEDLDMVNMDLSVNIDGNRWLLITTNPANTDDPVFDYDNTNRIWVQCDADDRPA
jgi:prepilin-type N-terminal cleavage/methylation domain-containing protein